MEYSALACARALLTIQNVAPVLEGDYRLRLRADALERVADRSPKQKAAQRHREILQLFAEAQRMTDSRKLRFALSCPEGFPPLPPMPKRLGTKGPE
jgi:hypothetical protein